MDMLRELLSKIGIHIHDWEGFGEKISRFTAHVEYLEVIPLFRKCRICGAVQEHHWDSSGGCWELCDEFKTEIFNEQIENGKMFPETTPRERV